MGELFLNIVNMSISASWIVLAVLLLRLLLKRAPKWITVLLWGVVAIRLICPFSIESVMSLIPSAETVNPALLISEAEINTGFEAVDNVVNPVINEAVTTIGTEKTVSTFKLLTLIFSKVWLIGIAILLIYTFISYRRVRRKVYTAVLLRDNIYQSDAVVSPFVLGVIKPKIYIPFNMGKQDEELVIAHEQAHIKRRDHLWKPLGFIILTLHWFNPLMWLGYVLLCRDIEIACDEKVVKELTNKQRADYSQALLTCSVNRRMIAACPLAFGEVSVKKRVKSVLSYKKPAFWLIIIGVIAIAITSACFLTNKKTDNDNPKLTANNGYTAYKKYYKGVEEYTEFYELSGISQEFIENFGTSIFGFSRSDIDDFFLRYDEQLPLGEAFQVKLKMKYANKTDFTLEKERIIPLSFECGYLFGADEYEIYATRLDCESYYEYALIDDKNLEIHYIYLQPYLPLEEIEIDSIFIPYQYEDLTVTKESIKTLDNETIIMWENVYKYKSENDVAEISLPTHTKRGQFQYSMFSSHVAYGTYEDDGEYIYLYADTEGLLSDLYTFKKDGNNLIFVADESKKLPSYRYSDDPNVKEEVCVPDGAVFEKVPPTLSHSVDYITFDIDKDGKNELCVLNYGPTSGLSTYKITVYEDSKAEYFNIFNLNGSSFVFKIVNDELKLNGVSGYDEGIKPVCYDIDITDGNTVLSNENETVSYWGEQGLNSNFAPKG